jgi:alpha-tubulin suppressor-like RCC1 family protein
LRGRPIYISAGESHSALVTDRFCLYTWGSGQYGRLGHGFDTNEKEPKLVEDLEDTEIVQVSCGAFHTLAITNNGQVVAFGQGKYGKLGINRKERDKAFSIPQKVTLYKHEHE